MSNVFPAVPGRSRNGVALSREGGAYRLRGTSTGYFEASIALPVEPGQRYVGWIEKPASVADPYACFVQDRSRTAWPNLLDRVVTYGAGAGRVYEVPDGCRELVCGFVVGAAGTEVDALLAPRLQLLPPLDGQPTDGGGTAA